MVLYFYSYRFCTLTDERTPPMKYPFLFLLSFLAAPTFATVQTDSCVVSTFDQNGQYLATVQTGDGAALSLKEASRLATLLNDRHNNGVNPVRATSTCS